MSIPRAVGSCVRLDLARPREATAAAPARTRLLMLGFAGGSVTALVPLARAFAPHVEVWGLEYPGRGLRWQQPAPADAATLLERLQPELEALALASPLPLALLGYSMGGHVAWQLAQRNPALVDALVVMGARPPQCADEDWHHQPLNDDQLVQRLQLLGGMPAEVLASPVLMEGFLPVMRADLAVCAGLADAAAQAARRPLACPLLALQGREDRLLHDTDIARWQQLPQCQPELGASRHYPGGHFFHRGIEAALAADIGGWLDRVLHDDRAAAPLPTSNLDAFAAP